MPCRPVKYAEAFVATGLRVHSESDLPEVLEAASPPTVRCSSTSRSTTATAPTSSRTCSPTTSTEGPAMTTLPTTETCWDLAVWLAAHHSGGHEITAEPVESDIFQVSTISALMAGVLDGDTPYADVMRHGDFEVGTFNALDGEMAALDGSCYHLYTGGRGHARPGRGPARRDADQHQLPGRGHRQWRRPRRGGREGREHRRAALGLSLGAGACWVSVRCGPEPYALTSSRSSAGRPQSVSRSCSRRRAEGRIHVRVASRRRGCRNW